MSGSSWRRALRFFRPDLKQDVDDKFGFHLEMRIRELIDRGMAPEAAGAAAERRFGAVGEVRTSCLQIDERRSRRSNRREAWTDLRQDLLVGARVLRRGPGFTLSAIALVALGVSTTATIVSALQGILIRPLPYAAASEPVSVYARRRGWSEGGINVLYLDWAAWREQNRTFSKLGKAARRQGGKAARRQGG
ncbi:MAG: permease prefix domain 1-containing protein, partial [Gemmatimonadota bacterium]